MNDLIYDIFLKYDLTLSDIKNICKSSKNYSILCKNNIEYILKMMLIKYNIIQGGLVHIKTQSDVPYTLLNYYFKNIYNKKK